MKTQFLILLLVILSLSALGNVAYATSPNYEIIPWDDFSFSDFGYDDRMENGIFTDNMAQISILQSGREYQIIQKVNFQAKDLRNVTSVNATVGYAIQPGDKMIRPPMGDNVTEAEHQAFAQSLPAQNEAFYQQSFIGDSYDFVVDLKQPFYIKFPIQINESGQYTRQYYKITHMFEGPTGFAMGGLTVVDKYSKAVNENGRCKNDSFRLLIKHDYSNLVCVDPANVSKLKERGWAKNSFDEVSDSQIIRYSPVLFKGSGVSFNDKLTIEDLQHLEQQKLELEKSSENRTLSDKIREDLYYEYRVIENYAQLAYDEGASFELVKLLSKKQDQISDVVFTPKISQDFPIVSVGGVAININGYSLDEQFAGKTTALTVGILKDEFTRENLVRTDKMIREHIGNEIDIVYEKSNYIMTSKISK